MMEHDFPRGASIMYFVIYQTTLPSGGWRKCPKLGIRDRRHRTQLIDTTLEATNGRHDTFRHVCWISCQYGRATGDHQPTISGDKCPGSNHARYPDRLWRRRCRIDPCVRCRAVQGNRSNVDDEISVKHRIEQCARWLAHGPAFWATLHPAQTASLPLAWVGSAAACYQTR